MKYSTLQYKVYQLIWLSYSYKTVKMLSVCVLVCLDVNQDGTNHSRCTQSDRVSV